MGQQQLLLVILVTIIVGIATVVAINVFGSSAESANRDAVRQDMLAIGAAAQGWYIKPTMMGGGGNSFEGMDFTKIQFAAENINGTTADNANGTYILGVGTGGVDGQITLTGHPSSCAGYVAGTGCTDAADAMQVTIVKDGMEDWTVGGEVETDGTDGATT